MIVNVRMVDRTLFQFASRRDLGQVMKRHPSDDRRSIEAWILDDPKIAPDDPRPHEGRLARRWRPIRVNHLREHSVAYVIAAADIADSDDDLPALAIAEERKRKWEERERERAYAEPAEAVPATAEVS